MSEWKESSESSCPDMEETIKQLDLSDSLFAKACDVDNLNDMVDKENKENEIATKCIEENALWSIFISTLKLNYSTDCGTILDTKRLNWGYYGSKEKVNIDCLKCKDFFISGGYKDHSYCVTFKWVYSFADGTNIEGLAWMQVPSVNLNGEDYYARPRDITIFYRT